MHVSKYTGSSASSHHAKTFPPIILAATTHAPSPHGQGHFNCMYDVPHNCGDKSLSGCDGFVL